MKVYGVEIPQTAIDAVVDCMKKVPHFTAYTLSYTLMSNGVPKFAKTFMGVNSIAERAAEKIVRQQSKAGNIAYDHKDKKWKWIGG